MLHFCSTYYLTPLLPLDSLFSPPPLPELYVPYMGIKRMGISDWTNHAGLIQQRNVWDSWDGSKCMAVVLCYIMPLRV